MADINITAINPRTRRVTFAFQIVPKKTKGIETLLQLSAKTILTTPGIDIFAPVYGGGLLAYSGRNLNIAEMPRIYADMAYIVNKSQEQILIEQMGNPIGIQDRLRSLTLLSIDYLPDESALDVRVLVTSEAGDSADISMANQLRFKRDEEIYDPAESLYRLSQELNGVYKLVMEYLYAYNGKKMLSTSDIAIKLGVTEQFVIDLRNRFSVRLKELQV
jgi:hypothetical protein